MERFELSRRFEADLPHFECGPFNHLGTSPDIVDSLAETREKQTSAAGLSPSAEGKPYAARHSKLQCKVILLSNLRRQKQTKLQKTAEMLKARQVIYFTQYTALRVGKAVHAAAFAGASLQFPDRFLL